MFHKETDNHKPDHRQTDKVVRVGNLGIPFHIAHDAAKQEWKISYYRVALFALDLKRINNAATQRSIYTCNTLD